MGRERWGESGEGWERWGESEEGVGEVGREWGRWGESGGGGERVGEMGRECKGEAELSRVQPPMQKTLKPLMVKVKF